ncbi:hypothetical protein [Saccharothrix luteola]|uniref:hypothetical protein n=1 Tax=Saccharothrix luteola TaxID=2893018 RepID=UPI001E3E8DF1|nr:hypothetical protein [Saccharothrix luteola]MCC8247648.1 hypothetical protein [Saccharothrix luteola]
MVDGLVLGHRVPVDVLGLLRLGGSPRVPHALVTAWSTWCWSGAAASATSACWVAPLGRCAPLLGGVRGSAAVLVVVVLVVDMIGLGLVLGHDGAAAAWWSRWGCSSRACAELGGPWLRRCSSEKMSCTRSRS